METLVLFSLWDELRAFLKRNFESTLGLKVETRIVLVRNEDKWVIVE